MEVNYVNDYEKIINYYNIVNKVNKIKKIDTTYLEKFPNGIYSEVECLLLPIYLNTENSPLEEFHYRLMTGDLYNIPGLTKYLLSVCALDEGDDVPIWDDTMINNNIGFSSSILELEKKLKISEEAEQIERNSTSIVNTKKATVEHIRPQKINSEGWSRDNYFAQIHTLGNLTLTHKNSTLSNKPFTFKKEIYKTEFPNLNKDIIDKEIWNLETTMSRGDRLARIIINRLAPIDLIDRDMIRRNSYYVNIYTYPLTRYKPYSIMYDWGVTRVEDEKDILEYLIKLLHKDYYFDFIEFIDEGLIIGNNTLCISLNPFDIRVGQDVRGEVWYNLEMSKKQTIDVIRILTEEFNLDYVINIIRK